MDPLGAVALPLQGGVHRRPVIGFAARLPLHQAHGLALDHVDGGQKYQSLIGWHVTHYESPSTQLLSSAAPASPLFSG